MTTVLQIILIVCSLAFCGAILHSIRKSKAKISDAVFWILFSGVMIVISIFPGIVELGAELIGVWDPVNFLFLSVIFILLVRIFRMTLRISRLESKVEALVQRYALDQVDDIEQTDEPVAGK